MLRVVNLLSPPDFNGIELLVKYPLIKGKQVQNALVSSTLNREIAFIYHANQKK